jgi:excinuclease ABC subunit B
MERALRETDRRRGIQKLYNKKHGITPETIKSNIKDILRSIYEADYWTVPAVAEEQEEYVAADEGTLQGLEEEMKVAAEKLDFERAAELRDRIRAIKKKMMEVGVKD